MKPKPSPQLANTEGMPAHIALAAALLTPEERAEGMRLAREILKLSPRKFALLMVRHIAPQHVFTANDEAAFYGVTAKTLEGMRARREVK